MGIRYDVFTPFTEAHNHISNFDFMEALTSTASTVSSALKIAGVNGVSDTAGIPTNYNNVAPRLGFSYSARPTHRSSGADTDSATSPATTPPTAT